MLETVGKSVETGIKTFKAMSTFQKLGIFGAGLGLIGVGLLIFSGSDDEEVVPAENVEVSDGDAVEDEVVSEVTDVESVVEK